MYSTLTCASIAIPAPVARTAPSLWPLPVPTPDEAADLFAAYELMPNPRRYLREDWPVPCACLVGVLLVGACGGIARARNALKDARADMPACGPRLALERATGWSEAFVTALDISFTFGSFDRATESYGRDRHGDADYFRGAAFGAATHQVLRDRGMLR